MAVAYIRFSSAAVARTVSFVLDEGLALIDIDASGNVVGVEFIG
jgi:uncharacterized protein YuzE